MWIVGRGLRDHLRGVWSEPLRSKGEDLPRVARRRWHDARDLRGCRRAPTQGASRVARSGGRIRTEASHRPHAGRPREVQRLGVLHSTKRASATKTRKPSSRETTSTPSTRPGSIRNRRPLHRRRRNRARRLRATRATGPRRRPSSPKRANKCRSGTGSRSRIELSSKLPTGHSAGTPLSSFRFASKHACRRQPARWSMKFAASATTRGGRKLARLPRSSRD